MSEELPAADVAETAAFYRFVREIESEKPSKILVKKQLKKIGSLAGKLKAALDESQDVLDFFGQDEGLHLTYLDQVRHVADLADLAQEVHEGIPRIRRKRAERLAALQLLIRFERHGLHFSATANADYDTESAAVAALRKVVRLAGDEMSAASARKWIESAIDESNKKLGKQSTKRRVIASL